MKLRNLEYKESQTWKALILDDIDNETCAYNLRDYLSLKFELVSINCFDVDESTTDAFGTTYAVYLVKDRLFRIKTELMDTSPDYFGLIKKMRLVADAFENGWVDGFNNRFDTCL